MNYRSVTKSFSCRKAAIILGMKSIKCRNWGCSLVLERRLEVTIAHIVKDPNSCSERTLKWKVWRSERRVGTPCSLTIPSSQNPSGWNSWTIMIAALGDPCSRSASKKYTRQCSAKTTISFWSLMRTAKKGSLLGQRGGESSPTQKNNARAWQVWSVNYIKKMVLTIMNPFTVN